MKKIITITLALLPFMVSGQLKINTSKTFTDTGDRHQIWGQVKIDTARTFTGKQRMVISGAPIIYSSTSYEHQKVRVMGQNYKLAAVMCDDSTWVIYDAEAALNSLIKSYQIQYERQQKEIKSILAAWERSLHPPKKKKVNGKNQSNLPGRN